MRLVLALFFLVVVHLVASAPAAESNAVPAGSLDVMAADAPTMTDNQPPKPKCIFFRKKTTTTTTTTARTTRRAGGK
ncbi:unnamed protein product [Allacma fusca]|uniref:Uncharacterized protein n=1 Tax=Allacma fusca TaxID=39272 RepID=A0A8J2JM66_9HEXA|nr:unnamed protein product [Allacma fusca]